MIRLGEATGDTEETGDASGGSVASVGRSIGEITGESDVIGPSVIGLGEATGDTEETGGASGGSVASVGRSIGEITGESNEFTREEKLLCNKFRSGVEERSANEEEEQRVDSQHSRQEFETNTKPNTCENNNGGKVEKI